MTAKEAALDYLNKLTDSIFESGHQVSKPMVKDIAVISITQILKDGKFIDWRLVDIINEIKKI